MGTEGPEPYARIQKHRLSQFAYGLSSLFLRYKVSLRKHTYSNILEILSPKIENFQIKNSDIFHISAQNIDCRGGSNEYPQTMFLSRK